MSSPVFTVLENNIHLQREKEEAIYLQITQQVIQLICSKKLTVGTKLPGSRVIANLLEVHRKTVVAAMDELQAQGWLSILPKKGAFIENPQIKLNRLDRVDSVGNQKLFANASFSFKRSFFLDSPFEEHKCDFAFNDGLPDIRLTKLDDLSRYYSSSLKRRQVSQRINDFSFRGNQYFLEQLCYFLNTSRGLKLQKENLLVTRSTEMCLYVLAHLLVEDGDCVLVGDKSYFSANMIFQQAGANIKTIPVDENGIQVEEIKKRFQKGDIRLIYLSSQHHYPTTVEMSSERKMALQDLADQYQFVILEDDYDYEFHYEKEQDLPMASNDPYGRVIYLGSFGKSLFPTFQTGFICGPKDLIHAANKFLGLLDPKGDVVMEQTLAEIIEEGEIHRHLKKALKTYRERRNNFVSLLKIQFQEAIQIKIPSGGLAIWMEWTEPISLMKLAERCQRKGVFIPRICMYQDQNHCALRLGFGHLNELEMDHVVKCMYQEYTFLIEEVN